MDVEGIKHLLVNSDYHNWFGVDEVEKYVRTPMLLDQYIVMRRHGRPVVFATWGFPSYEHIVYYKDNFEFPVEGFDGGGKDPWLIDFIAEGGKANIALGFRKLKSMLSNMGYSQAYWFRIETGKLGFHKWSN
ncbi:MAG: toxin-activating lysine-acyltransferase [Pelagibacteraceae bacterium]